MTKIIFATGNKNKLHEINEILAGTDYHVISMKEAGINIDIVEDGSTFLENALIKARAIATVSGELTMADDSGLVIDALNGEPGIYSARYLGEDTPYTTKNAIILDRMKDVPTEERTARFVCAMAAICPDGTELTTVQNFDGLIADAPAGENGFGYDPILYLPEKGCTSAELSEADKNAISHRGKALRKMKEMLETYACTDHQ
ncbi:MAG: XTP/dITP diphosphatase [Lachnospiraceae bacterium]|nr:XTP/dITP diphosphatase [Candidatus Equihabitans merdae]